MNSNKENLNKLKSKSKIPLPIEPLPALSIHLLKKRHNSENERRHPLQTIKNHQPNQSNQTAGPSENVTKIISNSSRYPVKVDTRHVTVRQRSEDLDWDYKVFRDKSEEENSIISVSDDEDCVKDTKKEEVRYFVDNKQRNCLGESRAVTPGRKSPSLEPSRIRNIKRSLKRPHSRELQGLSPVAKQERRGEERYKRRLNFSERLQSPDFFKKSYMECLTRDYTTDLFAYLLSVEDKPTVPRIASITRACVINWLMKVNGPEGDPAIVQTACWYLDAILATGCVPLDKLQLVAAACYWIAQKLHGPSVLATRLVRYANKAFSAEQLMAAEKAVLYKLKFPRQPVVAQDYITYLSWLCDNGHPGEIEVAATFLCMSGLMVDKALCNECPSVVAVAAVRNALLLLRKRDMILRLQMCNIFKTAEKKTSNMSFVCSVLRKAVRVVCVSSYEYKAPFEHYNCGPHHVAQKIVNAAKELAVIDTRIPGYQGFINIGHS